MKKWIKRLLLCLSVCLPLYLSAAVWARRPAVVDEADLFSYAEEQELSAAAASDGSMIGAELVIVTVDRDTGYSGKQYARKYLLEQGYGYGEGREGILFLIDMHQREYTVYEYNDEASGYLLTDYEGDCILDELENNMKSGRYYEAAKQFLESCVYYAGTDLGENYPSEDEPASLLDYLPFCMLIGLIGGAVITGIMAASRNHDSKASAGAYSRDGSVRIVRRDDRFMRTTVIKRRIERETNHSNNGGGGGFSGGNSGGGHGGSRGF